MIFDVWTILNPILRTFIYFSVLTTIGTILFSLHFSNFFDNIVKVYCQNLIKKFSIFGLFIGLLVFLSVAGNLGGDFQSVINISLIMLTFETLSGKSAILLTTGFTLIIFSILNYKFFPVLFKTLGILSILFSFVKAVLNASLDLVEIASSLLRMSFRTSVFDKRYCLKLIISEFMLIELSMIYIFNGYYFLFKFIYNSLKLFIPVFFA